MARPVNLNMPGTPHPPLISSAACCADSAPQVAVGGAAAVPAAAPSLSAPRSRREGIAEMQQRRNASLAASRKHRDEIDPMDPVRLGDQCLLRGQGCWDWHLRQHTTLACTTLLEQA